MGRSKKIVLLLH